MTQTITSRTSRRSKWPRRTGRFAVGAFAGLCATFLPRLMLVIDQQARPAGVQVEPLAPAYVAAAFGFSLLVGGVVLILEWEGKRPPRDTFMAALGVPALLTSMLNTSTLSREVLDQAARLRQVSDQLADQAGIAVEDAGFVPPDASFLPRLMPTAYAQERHAAPPRTSRASAAQDSRLGVRFREPAYWIVLHATETKVEADRKAADLRRYGPLTVERVGKVFYVCPSGGPLPYSTAVSKAAALKEQSAGVLHPKLVRAGSGGAD